MSKSFVSKWETEKTVPPMETLHRLSLIFDITAQALLNGKREKKDIARFIICFVDREYEKAQQKLFKISTANVKHSKKKKRDGAVWPIDDLVITYMLMMNTEMLKQTEEAALSLQRVP